MEALTKFKRVVSWFLIAVALFGVGLGLAVYLTRHQPIARVSLPDGTELRLEYMTYGVRHRITGSGRFLEWISSKLERFPRLGIRYQMAEYTFRTNNPSYVLWFTNFDPKTGKHVRPSFSQLELQVLMEPGEGYYPPIRSNFTPPLPNYCFAIPTFERRKATFRVRVFDRSAGFSHIIEVPNPLAGAPFPEWKPEPLPQTRRIAGGQVTLHSFDVSDLLRDRDAGIKADFRVTDDLGQRAPGMTVRLDRITDATGNRASKTALPPFLEPAWKVTAAVRRSGDFAFPAEAGLTLGPVPMPAAGEMQILPVPTAEARDGLRAVILTGPGSFTWRDDLVAQASPTSNGGSVGTASGNGTSVSMEIAMPYPVVGCLFGYTLTTRRDQKWMKAAHKLAVRLKWAEQGTGARVWTGSGGRSWGTTLGDHAAFVFRQPRTPLPPPGTPVFVQLVPGEPELVDFLIAPPSPPATPKPRPRK